jgi:hypothetical protein
MSTFIQRLSEHDELNENLIESLRKALQGPRLPKADDFVALIIEATGEAVA